jgi:hypothetical protein
VKATGQPIGESARGHLPLKFSDAVTTTLPIAKSGGSLIVVVPKHLVDLLGLERGAVLELTLRRVTAARIQPSEFELA